jgi:type II secretory pathway pseudopilin PulG
MSSYAESRRGGFILLEAVIALAILSAVIVSLLAATGGQLRTAGDATGLLTAQALAEDRITTFRMLDYEGLRAPPDSLRAGSFPLPLQAWGWETVIQEDAYDLFRVVVTIRGPGTVFPLETSIHRARPVISGNGGGR